MANESVRDAERALDAHDAFEPTEPGYAVSSTPFDATVRVDATETGVSFTVTVRVPTIDAVVRGETVAPVVQDGWRETFERRMADVGGVTRVEPETPSVQRDPGADELVVRTSFRTDRVARGVADAKAIVDYVDGTFMEGVIPGYDYREPVAGMIERARNQGEEPAGDG